MQTIVIAAHADHGYGFSTLALLALSVVVVGLIGWQLFARSFRGRG